MNDFKEYLRFPDIETINEYTTVLEKHNIPFEVDDASMRFKVVSTNNPWENQFILKIKDSDIEIVNELIESEVPEFIKNIPSPHYLYSFSDKDLLEILDHQKEWTNDEVSLATTILNERKIEIPKNPDNSNSFPEKPTIEKSNSTLLKSFGSVILFIAAYYFFLNRDLNFIFILVGVLLIHELGHFIAMKFYKYLDLKMFFIPLLGALVTGEKKVISQRQHVIILLSGPIPGIIIGLILYFIGVQSNSHFIIISSNIFIFLNLFNLLPLTPLDGGKLISTLFFSSKEIINTIFLAISAVILTIIAIYLHTYILLIIPFFMLTQISQQSRIKKIKSILDQESINYNKPYEELTSQEYWLIREQVISNSGIFKEINPNEFKVTDKEKLIINQIKSLASIPIVQDLSGIAKFMYSLLWFFFLVSPLIIRAAIKHYLIP